jgi:hypothetical protein
MAVALGSNAIIWRIRRDSNESDTREPLSIIRPVLQATGCVVLSCPATGTP